MYPYCWAQWSINMRRLTQIARPMARDARALEGVWEHAHDIGNVPLEASDVADDLRTAPVVASSVAFLPVTWC